MRLYFRPRKDERIDGNQYLLTAGRTRARYATVRIQRKRSHVLDIAEAKDEDGRDKPGHDDAIKENAEAKIYSAGGALGFVRTKVFLRLSHSSILAPFLCMITLCCATESELFQAQ